MKPLKLKVDKQGRIILPQIIRDAYDIHPGQEVSIILAENGIIINNCSKGVNHDLNGDC
jgi:AbrB family looped-hinge helix DNA binding protein